MSGAVSSENSDLDEGGIGQTAAEITPMDPAQRRGALEAKLSAWRGMTNMASLPSLEDELGKIASKVDREYELDENSRADWKEKYRKWMDFALQIAEQKDYPWPNASNVIYPLITTAALQFHARAYPAIIRNRNVVQGVVIGDDTGKPAVGPDGKPITGPSGPYMAANAGDKRKLADKIGAHMSWQLLDEQQEWEPQTDRLLIVIPIVGTMFRKSYFDPAKRRNVAVTVSAMDLCVNYKATSFEDAPRHTEIIRLYPWEIETYIRAGLFLDEDYGHDTDGEDQADDDARVTFLEQHRRLDLDDDGYAEPYIVTVAKGTGKVARIRAGWDDETITWNAKGDVEKIDRVEVYTKYGFIPSPDSTVYDMGFGHLLFPINDAINTTLNQMFDAGHLQIVGGGFVGSGLSINAGAVRFAMGEYKPVNTMGGNLRDQILPLTFPGPNAMLHQLLMFLVEAGERVASVKDVLTGEMPSDNTSGISILATIEQGLKVFTAIYQRVYRSLGYEFRKQYRLNRLYLSDESGFQNGSAWESITRKDYELGSGVQPVSDPRMVTDQQRIGRAQFMLMFKDDPRVNGQKIIRDSFAAANVEDPDSYMAQQPGPDPKVALKNRELDIRQAHDQGKLQVQHLRDIGAIHKDLAQAELSLAQAQATGADTDLGWIRARLEHLRLQLDETTAAAGIHNQVREHDLREKEIAAAGAGGADA